MPSSTLAAPPSGVTFDSAPVPASATPPPGVVFDTAPVPGAPTSTDATGTTGQPVAVPDSLHIDPNGNPLLNAAKRANAVGAGIGDGLLTTINGSFGLEDRVAKHLPTGVGNFVFGNQGDRTGAEQLLQSRQQDLEQQNRENPGLNATGQTTETLAEFLSGDELLKGLTMGDKFLKFSKIASALESSPLAMRAFTIGANALRQGVVQGVSTGVKTGSAGQGALQGGFGAAATGAVESAVSVPAIYRDFFSQKVVQDGLQNGIRNILAKTADAAGVDTGVTDTPSLRDAANALGTELKARAGRLYSSLDTATGGRIQRFGEQLEEVEKGLANSIDGVDAEGTKDLAARQTAILKARSAAVEKIKAAGLDPAMLDEADAKFKQGSALTDLSTAIRNSVNGLRPELSTGATNTPETVATAKLGPRLNKLADKGRLAQAIGKDNADALLAHVDAAELAGKRVAARLATGASAVKLAAQAGGIGAGYEAAKHLFSGQ